MFRLLGRDEFKATGGGQIHRAPEASSEENVCQQLYIGDFGGGTAFVRLGDIGLLNEAEAMNIIQLVLRQTLYLGEIAAVGGDLQQDVLIAELVQRLNSICLIFTLSHQSG